MHPKNLPLCRTDTAFDGSPVTQFRVSGFVDDASVTGKCWAYDADEAREIARRWWQTTRLVAAIEVME